MANSFLLLEGDFSGFLLLEGDFSGKLIIGAGVDDGSVGHGYLDWRVTAQQQEYQESVKREKIKQNEVIRLRLEAQDALLRKQELTKLEQDKQTRRQLAALEKEYDALMAELADQLRALAILQQITLRKRRAVLTLLLMASCPFITIN